MNCGNNHNQLQEGEFDLTTMYFVYVDSKPDGTPFYVGKGRHLRVQIKARANKHHASICAKYPNWERGLAFMGKESDALKKEVELIAKFGRVNSGTGTLCNLTDGGEGSSGFKHTEEAKLKITNGLIGRKHSEETKSKIKQSNFGLKRTQEQKINIGKASLGRKIARNPQKHICLECGRISGNLEWATKHQNSTNHAGKVIL